MKDALGENGVSSRADAEIIEDPLGANIQEIYGEQIWSFIGRCPRMAAMEPCHLTSIHSSPSSFPLKKRKGI